MFKKKIVNQVFLGRKYRLAKYQCPICGRWFISYTDSVGGILQHITKIAKIEAVGKQLGELKKAPHFNFWKKYTRPSLDYSIKREWIITSY